MAYANVTYAGIGGTQAYTIPFPFLAQAHVKVNVNGVAKTITTDYTINGAGTTLTLVAPVVGGEVIYIYRDTPKATVDRIVDWTNGSVITESNLDTSDLQLLYITQEGFDESSLGLQRATDEANVWEAEGLRIKNGAVGTLATDYVIKSQLDSVAAVAGNLPPVSGADNNSSLAVNAGLWAVRTPAQMRTHLGLGTAAVANTGVAAGNVPAMDGSGRYPAADGRNIDVAQTVECLDIRADFAAADAVLQAQINAIVPTFILLSFNAQAMSNDVSGTWLTATSGTLHRMDITSGGTFEQNDGAGNFTISAGNDTIALLAGTYLFEVHIVIRNSDPANVGAYQWALTNDVGTTVYIDGTTTSLHVTANDLSPGTVHGAALVTFASNTTVAFRRRNNAAAGALATAGNGAAPAYSYALIRKLA